MSGIDCDFSFNGDLRICDRFNGMEAPFDDELDVTSRETSNPLSGISTFVAHYRARSVVPLMLRAVLVHQVLLPRHLLGLTELPPSHLYSS